MALKNEVLRSINIYGLDFQTRLMFGLDTTPEENESLNELWGVHPDLTPRPTDKPPFIQYFAIGNKGHRNVVIGDGYQSTELNQHRTSDAGLFEYVPFIARRIADDLSTEERRNYGMRVPREINGEAWVLYYFKVIDLSSTAVEKTKVTVNNGVETIEPFNAESSDLTPTPPDVPNPGNNPVNGTTLFALANVPIHLTALELSEVRTACELVFGNTAYAHISEIQLIRATKRPAELLDINFQGTGVNYDEAIQAVGCFFISGSWPIRFMDELDFTIDGGGGVPLLGPSQTVTVQNP